MLNYFTDYKRCIHTSYYILDFVQWKKTKFTMEQPYMLPITYCQYHSCWSPGDLRSQLISKQCQACYWPNKPAYSITRIRRVLLNNYTTGNSWCHHKLWVSMVAVDALPLRHQAISIHIWSVTLAFTILVFDPENNMWLSHYSLLVPNFQSIIFISCRQMKFAFKWKKVNLPISHIKYHGLHKNSIIMIKSESLGGVSKTLMSS